MTPPAAETPVDKNAHIPSDEIWRDIRDTQAEVRKLFAEIDERETFIMKLRTILAARGENSHD